MKFYFLGLLLIANAALPAKEACAKCERIREYNKEHPGGEYEFYEDYLKAQDNKSTQKQTASDQGLNSK